MAPSFTHFLLVDTNYICLSPCYVIFFAKTDVAVPPINSLTCTLETKSSSVFKNYPNKEFQGILNDISTPTQLINIEKDWNLLAEFQQKPLHNR